MNDRRYRATLGLGLALPFLVVGIFAAITQLGRGCTSLEDVTPPQRTFDAPPCPTVSDDFSYLLTFETSVGRIRLSADPIVACDTTNNIVFLVRAGFYDGLTVHKVEAVDGSHAFIQLGDPTGTGRGNAGYTYTAEPPSPVTRYVRGTAAMVFAGDDPATASSQFFIVVDDYDDLSYPARQPVNTLFGGTGDPESLRTLDLIVTKFRAGEPHVVIERATVTETRRFGEEGDEVRPCAEGQRVPTVSPTPDPPRSSGPPDGER